MMSTTRALLALAFVAVANPVLAQDVLPLPGCVLLGNPEDDTYLHDLCPNGRAHERTYMMIYGWSAPKAISASYAPCPWDYTKSAWICRKFQVSCTPSQCSKKS